MLGEGDREGPKNTSGALLGLQDFSRQRNSSGVRFLSWDGEGEREGGGAQVVAEVLGCGPFDDAGLMTFFAYSESQEYILLIGVRYLPLQIE